MSRITRWKPEKTKTKVVFRLQFHATYIPQSGWDKLFITFIPVDSGKATAKTTKASVRNGTCKWADPIYETTRLLQDLRTRQFDEKLYKFVVSMGSSRSSLLGEATINLADYADALKPSSISLPLHGCDFGAILHVTVQLLTAKTGFREFEQQRELMERGLLTTSDHNSRESVSGRLSSPGDAATDHAENSRVNLKAQYRGHPSTEEDSTQNEDHVGSPSGFDGSSNTSGSLYADKHDTMSLNEIDAQNSDQKYPTHGPRNWVHTWDSAYAGDNDSAIAYDENSRLRGSLELAESSLHDLKLELSSVQGYADELGVEAQKFAQQLAAEMALGENLAREVAILKTECSKFKREIEVLKDSNNKLRFPSNGRESAGNVEEPIFQDLQLRWLKGLLLAEDKLREVQDKACFGFSDTDLRMLGSDLEAMLMMLKDLKQGTGEVISSLNYMSTEGGSPLKELAITPNLHENEEQKSTFGLGTDLYQPESMLLHSVDVSNLMKNRVDELMRELEESKSERENLVQKMAQMECYYEALIQELEGNQRHMLGELQNLRNEHSACLYAVSSTNAEMERMRQDMNDKLLLFTEERRELDALNKELERRALTAEAALKRARLNYSIAVGQLQKDLELLSSQVSSMYEANQNIIKEAFEDPEELNLVVASKSRCLVQKKQNSGGEALLDNLRISLNMQEELYRKVEDEVRVMHHEIMYFDIFSRSLQETLLEAISDIGVKMNEKDEIIKQLGLCKNSNDVLMLKLRTSLDEVDLLNKEKTALSMKFHEMTRWKENLEASLRSVTNENGCLMQKITELENSLSKEMVESSDLKNGNIALQEKLLNLTDELHELECVKQNLEKRVGNLQEEMQLLLTSHDEKLSRLTGEKEILAKEREMAHASLSTSESAKENLEKVVSDLQEKLHSLLVSHDERLCQLVEEADVLTKERDAARTSLSASESAKESLEELVTGLRQKLEPLLLHHDKNFNGASLDLFAIISQLGEFQDIAQKKISILMKENEDLAMKMDESRASFSTLESAKESLQKVIDNLEEKLRDLLLSHQDNCDGTPLDLFDIISHIGESHNDAHKKISELIAEKEALVKERDAAQAILSSVESEKENVQKLVDNLEEKLLELLMFHLGNGGETFGDLFDIISQIGKSQMDERRKISELIGEKEALLNERDVVQAALSSSESEKENLQKLNDNLEERLRELLMFHRSDDGGTSRDMFDIISQIKESQRDGHQKISELMEEKEALVNERDVAHAALSSAESEKRNLQKLFDNLEEKLREVLAFHHNDDGGTSSGLFDIISQLGKSQRDGHQKISELMGEKEVLVNERDVARAALTSSESEKENLQKLVDNLEEKLREFHHNDEDGTSGDLFHIISQIGKSQRDGHQKISELMEEKEALVNDRDVAQAALSSSESEKDNLRKLVNNLEEKLRELLMFHHSNGGGTSGDLFDIISQIGKSQRDGHQKISELIGEKQALVKERDVAQAALSSSESEKENLRNLVSRLQEKLRNLLMSYDEAVDGSSLDLIEALSRLEEFQSDTHRKISEITGENRVLAGERDSAKSSLSQMESDILAMKENFASDLRDMLAKMNVSNLLVQKLQLRLENMASRLTACLKDEEIYEEQQKVLIVDLNSFKAELEEVIVKNGDLAVQISSLQNLSEQLEMSKVAEEEFAKENHSLMGSLREKTEECVHLLSELTELKVSLRCLNEELHRERESREELEKMISDLASELNETRSQLPDVDKQRSELVQLRQSVSNLESEKLRLSNLLSQKEEEYATVACQEAFSSGQLEDQLFEMHGHLITSNTQLVFTQSQYRRLTEDVIGQLKLSEKNLGHLHEKHLDLERRLNSALANEAQLIEENAELSRNIETLGTDLEAAASQNRILIGRNDAFALELEEHRKRYEVLDGSLLQESQKHRIEIEELMGRLASSEEEINRFFISSEELTVELLVLKYKLREQCEELAVKETECKELSEKLSTQVLKTEEFRSLSTQMKELKDNAEAECAKARAKKEADSPSYAVQESLRIAFIKEQYETKVQELKQQVLMSKKHSEEMLLKLQDAVDEIENRKRIEASNLRRNEELSMKILDLESELQELVTDKREKAKAYDCMQAEMECSLISLECCKEEKQKLEVSLQECCMEKSKVEAELAQVKELLESSKMSVNHSEVDFCSSPFIEMQTKQELIPRGENGIQSLALINGESSPHDDANDFALVHDQFKVQGLRSSMENLNKELEKMKNENWLLPHEDHQPDSKFPDLERELLQLDKANQELSSIYPSFNEFGGGSNSLERVLALELELANALQSKKSSISFQSSFLRQHSDEVAIFKSFKDINELIRDMLELKGRYSTVESELKEMHGRYSQLSLQFAEVEGERQKLMMTLKCVRSSKKALNLNRSSSASLGENS